MMGASKGLKRAKPFPLTPISRLLFFQTFIMVLEGFLPSLMALILGLMAVFTLGQWGLAGAIGLAPLAPEASVSPGALIMMVAVFVAVILMFRRMAWPKDRQLWERLAHDNGLNYQDVLSLRHSDGPHGLRLRRPRAFLSYGDPLALRFILILSMGLGLWLHGTQSITSGLNAIRGLLLPLGIG